jgi:Flp pilus assembly protein TadG
MSISNKGTRGSAHVEFALCAVFMIFLLISIFDMARGLWINHTVAEAVRDGTRYAIVRGAGYVDPTTNTRLSGATVGAVTKVVCDAATGLGNPSEPKLMLKLYSNAGVIPSDCSNTSDPTIWPPDGVANAGSEIGISATYPYNSMVVMFFPGAQGVQFGKYILGSTARETIVF